MLEHPEPPPTAQELDDLIYNIDAGTDSFAALSDEQREQLKAELGEAWLSEYLEEYPVPADLVEASHEYREIESGDKYPNLPDNIRNDLLLHFDEHHGEGGPERWVGIDAD